MNIIGHFWYSIVGSWAFVLGHKRLLCWAVSKPGQKGLANQDALFWFMTLSRMKLKNPSSAFFTQLYQALQNLLPHIDQSSDKFCYGLLFLAEDTQKHNTLLKLYPSLQMSPQAQTFFFSTLCHSTLFKSLEKDSQDNLFIGLFDQATLLPFASLTEVDQQVMKNASKFAIDQHVYNLFLSWARNLPPKSFCHALANTKHLPPCLTLLYVLSETKEVIECLVKHHPTFVFQTLSSYVAVPNWESCPVLPSVQLSLLAVRKPLLSNIYHQSCLEYIAQTQKQEIQEALEQQCAPTQQKRRM